MQNQLVILGAAAPKVGELPSALAETSEGARVLDWVLNAFDGTATQVYYVGGSRLEEVTDRYPNIRFRHNPDWANTGPLASLARAPLDTECLYICYGDIVFRRRVIELLESSEAPCTIAVEGDWEHRYGRRTQADRASAERVVLDGDMMVRDVLKGQAPGDGEHEFCGIVKLQGPATAALKQLLKDDTLPSTAGLPTLLRRLLADGISIAAIDIGDQWAELNAPQDLARFVLGTKAESLERLRPLLRSAHIGDQIQVTHQAWRDSKGAVLDRIQTKFQDGELAVRSSSHHEDGWTESSAGAFETVLNVPTQDVAALSAAVDDVFASYPVESPDSQVLVQGMLTGVTRCGVAMTRTPTTGAGYYVINFDESGATDGVTSGSAESMKSVTVHRDTPADLMAVDPLSRDLIVVLRELEVLVGHSSLDVEFAFTEGGQCHVLQVRPIAVAHPLAGVADDILTAQTRRAAGSFAARQGPAPLLLGDRTFLSLMADWNPAEMIGVKPSRLAFSLYRTLITDETWASHRAALGYRDVRAHPLITQVLGQPYVDIRVDFNSFVPASIDERLAQKVVEAYLAMFARRPELHDKVEFEILSTCTTFDPRRESARLQDEGLSEGEVQSLLQALVPVTQETIRRLGPELANIERLNARRRAILDERDPLQRALLLLSDARRLGAEPFAHIARAGFVAVSFLKTLESSGVITREEREQFQNSVHTVGHQLQTDAYAVKQGTMAWEPFVARYGHLRPGTYDITSLTYREQADEMLKSIVDGAEPVAAHPGWGADTRAKLSAPLAASGLDLSADALCDFMGEAIVGRESAKFDYTANVSCALDAIVEFGCEHGLSRDELARVEVSELRQLAALGPNPEQFLSSVVERSQSAGHVLRDVRLPPVISNESDFWCFEQSVALPNYITTKRVSAEVRFLGAGQSASDLEGRIVVIPNADPGYDWIFSQHIGGLITMFGGENSHMAIRAAEFGLPAAIGVGEVLYDHIASAKLVSLDCEGRRIEVLG